MSYQSFSGEMSAYAAVPARYVMGACDGVRSIVLLPPMMGAAFVLVVLTGLIVSDPKH